MKQPLEFYSRKWFLFIVATNLKFIIEFCKQKYQKRLWLIFKHKFINL